MNSKNGFKQAYIAICVAGIFAASAAQANNMLQDGSADTSAVTKSDTNAVETVTVIGARQAYRGEFSPLETPQSELIISSEVLANAGAFDLLQALDLSSSVSRQNNFGGLWNSFAVRGFVGDENLPSNYLVNGFNAGRGFGGARDLSGIESVEVLKGPRAALFGRGEPGGTINLVTKRANFDEKTELNVLVGSFNTARVDIDVNTPISDDLAIRLVGFYEDAESFRDTVETTKQGLSPSVLWKISDDSQLTYELEYSHQEIPFDRGVIAIDGELGVIPESRFLGEPGYGQIETDVLGHQIEFQQDLNADWSALVGFNYRDTSLEGLASENGFSTPDEDGNFGRFSRYRDYNAVYQVFRAELSGSFDTGALKHSIIMGIDADEFENDQFALRDRSTDQSINIFNPTYGLYPESSLALAGNIDRVETQESVGVYIQDQISLTEKLDIRIGARFDDYQQKLVNRRSESVSEYSESKLSPQLGVVYKVSDALSFYAAYGENFRPLSGATDENGLDPNQSESAEVGVKFALNDGALSGTFAVFDVKQSNIATFDADFNATAIGEAASKGAELDITGNITDTLSIWVSYSYVDAETKNDYTDFISFNFIPAGSELLNIAENQFSLQLVKQAVLGGKELDLIASLVYVGERSGEFGDPNFKLPEYTTVRLASSYQLSDSLTLRAEVNNLFDEEYYTNSYASVWVQPGTPRSFRVSATYSF
jgi:iron complex outermembrane receptor protein